MSEADRRTFLFAAGHVALGGIVLCSDSAYATSPPPPPPRGTALKVIEGDGLIPLPAGASRRLGSQQMRIAGHINAIQFSPRGNTLVAASGSELRAWDPRTGKVLFRLNYPQRASVSAGRLTSADTFALLVQPDSGGKYEIRHYAFGDGKSLSESPSLDLGQAQHTAFAVDGTLMAVVRQEALHLYDGKGVEKWREPLPPEAIGGCRFFGDGLTLAVSTKGEVKLYTVATGKPAGTLKTGDLQGEVVGDRGKDWLGEPVISPDGKWLAASVGEDGDDVFCWEVNTGKLRHRLKSAKPIGFSPDSGELITFKDMVATVWTVATGAVARTIDVPSDEDLVLSPDGKILASSAADAAILIDAATGKHLPHSADPPGLPTGLRFHGDSRLIGILPGWGGWIEWDVHTGSSRLVRPPNVRGHTPIGLSANASAGLYRKKTEYTLLDMKTGKALVTVKDAEAFNETIPAAAMTPNGQVIVTPTEEGLAVVDASGRKVIRRRGDAEGSISFIATSGDGRWAAMAHRNSEQHNPVDIYDLLAGQFHRRLSIEGEISQVSFAGDGSWLAVAKAMDHSGRSSQDQRAIILYDPLSGRVVLRTHHEGYEEPVFAVSPGGRMLAHLETRSKPDGKSDSKIAIWDVLGSAVRVRLDLGESGSALAFSPDSRTLAASISGGPVFLWDLHTPAKDVKSPSPADLNRAWDNLRGADAEAAWKAIKLLASAPGQAVPFLREKVTPVPPPDPEQVKRLIAGLDDKDYRRREAAMRALAELGDRVRDPLTQASKPGQSPEVRERAERLLAVGERPTPDYLRRVRAVEAVELAATSEAKKLLQHWASGAAGALFTHDAGEAAKRLAAR